MNFAPLKNGVEAIKKSAERYQAAFAKWQVSGTDCPFLDHCPFNAQLIQMQRMFLTDKGLPERPWFRHQVYAPGAYTGYGAKPIAAVREYMDQEKWNEADAQIPMVGQVSARMLPWPSARPPTPWSKLDKNFLTREVVAGWLTLTREVYCSSPIAVCAPSSSPRIKPNFLSL